MNSSFNTKISDGLKGLCASNGAAQRLFESFSKRTKDATETSVDRAAWLAGSDYGSMVKVFKELGALGVGRFIPGRHGYASRIEWAYSIRSLGKVAVGAGQALAEVPADATADDEAPSAANAGLKHEFQLRDGVKVAFELPADLSEKEADRLAAFVKALPF